MSKNERKRVVNRYGWLEAGFFIIYFILLPVISAVQYSLDYDDRDNLYTTFIYFGVSSIFTIAAYLFYYKWIIPRFLFTRKYVLFILALLLYLLIFDFYILYVIDLSVSKMWFLPDAVQKLAANAFARGRHLPRQSIAHSLTTITSVTALAYFVRTLQKEREINDLRQQQLQLELSALKAQLHPHFFFNTLNNIYSLALQRSEETPVVVRKLADMMRYMLYDTSGTKVAVQKEISFINDYVELENIRHDKNSNIRFDLQGDMRGLQIEPFLLLPFVENAFKHGLAQEISYGFVEITIVIDEGELLLQASNSKPSQPPLDHQSGLGLTNVRKRLSLLYPGTHTLQITEDAHTYRVLLTLTLADAELPDR